MPSDTPAPFSLPSDGTKPRSVDPVLESIRGQVVNDAPTSAAEWRSARKQGFVVTLPSGQKAMVRRTLDLFAKLKEGKIPNPLASQITRMIEENRIVTDEKELGEEGVIQMLDMFDETLEAMMITPRFERPPADAPWNWEPSAGAIGPDDMMLEDKVFLFGVAQGGTADVASFRQQSSHLVAGGDVVEAAVGPTEQPD
jgi:hypothetical protein